MNHCVILFLCAIFVGVKAWVGLIPADPATAHLGDCYTTYGNLGAFTRGEEKRIEGECAIATCHTDGVIGLTGCGTVHVDPPYKVVPGDLSKPFPDCCYEIIGPINETNFGTEGPIAGKSAFTATSLSITQSK